MPYNSSTVTDPFSQTLDRSFRTRSTTITFSERSFSLLYKASRLSISSLAFLLDVPLIGCEIILLPVFLRNRSGLEQISHWSSTLYNAENGFGEMRLRFL